MQRMRKLCASREICTADALKKIVTWGLPETDAGNIIRKLQEEEFIDDRRYAMAAVQDKFKFNKWGTYRISQFLRSKGIPGEIVKEALSGIDRESVQALAEKLIQAKNRSIRGGHPLQRKAKLLRYAQAKGFETEMVFGIIEKLLQSSN